MKSVSWWQWLCIGLLAAACSLVTTGCDDDDNDKSDDGGGTVVAPDDDDDGGDDGKDDGDDDDIEDDGDDDPEPHPPLQVPVKTEVLWDENVALMFGDSRESMAKLPADGKVSITASWTAIDLMVGGASIDSPIQFRVNHAMLSDHNSPYSWSGNMSKGEYCEMVVKNNVTDTRATVHVRAVFTPD